MGNNKEEFNEDLLNLINDESIVVNNDFKEKRNKIKDKQNVNLFCLIGSIFAICTMFIMFINTPAMFYGTFICFFISLLFCIKECTLNVNVFVRIHIILLIVCVILYILKSCDLQAIILDGFSLLK